jgi:hypothetical protein
MCVYIYIYMLFITLGDDLSPESKGPTNHHRADTSASPPLVPRARRTRPLAPPRVPTRAHAPHTSRPVMTSQNL